MKIQYQRDGDDTFWVLHDGVKIIRGKLKNFQNGLMKNYGNGNVPSSRSDLKWLTDKQYHGK
jgi:hypothetical protein